MNPEKLLYSKTHEWVRVEADTATIGITDFAVEQLTDLVYLELPKVGAAVSAGEPFGEIESVKAVSDLYSPVDGQVVAVNAALRDDLGRLSQDAFGAGWMIKVKLSDKSVLDELMDYDAYREQIAEEEV